MKLLVHGSGFARPFRTDPEELRCGKPREVRGNPLCHWSPGTVDWEALGRSSGGSNGVADVSGLLALIRAQARDSIEELRIIGHSNGAFLALGGRVKLDEVEFDEAAMIGDSRSFGTLRSAFRMLQDRFRADGKVTFTDLDAATQAEWDAALAGAPAQWLAEQTDKTAAEAVLTRAQAIAGE